MDLFGVGGSELLVLLFLAGVLLGPRRLARLARDMGKLLSQIRTLTADLTKQLNREIDLIEAPQRKSSQSAKSEEQGPEAYRRFREDFPNEGKLNDVSSEAGRHTGPGGQPVGTQSAAQSGDVGAAVAPAPSSPGRD